MPIWKITGNLNVGISRTGYFLMNAIERGKANIAGAKHQFTTIGVDGGLLGVDPVRVFSALDDDIRLQTCDQRLRGVIQQEGIIDSADGANAFEAEFLLEVGISQAVRIDSDDEKITAFRCKIE